MLSVILPAWHLKRSSQSFLIVYFGICILYNIYWIVNIYIEMTKDPGLETICLITDAQPGWTQLYWFNACLVINLLTILCYVVIGITIKLNKSKFADKGLYKHFTSPDASQELFKSLFAVTLMIFLGWMLYAVVNLIVNLRQLTPILAWHVRFYAGIMVNLAISSNYFILYLFRSRVCLQ